MGVTWHVYGMMDSVDLQYTLPKCYISTYIMMDIGIRRITASVSDIADTEDKSCIYYGCFM